MLFLKKEVIALVTKVLSLLALDSLEELLEVFLNLKLFLILSSLFQSLSLLLLFHVFLDLSRENLLFRLLPCVQLPFRMVVCVLRVVKLRIVLIGDSGHIANALVACINC